MTLKDKGSTNGTYLNGRRLESEQRMSLHSGDVISLSDKGVDLQFLIMEKE